MKIIFALGIILVTGYFFGLVAERFKFPRVSAYLLSGILFSEQLLGSILHLDFNSWSDTLVQVCLGFIAYIVGGEIRYRDLRATGKTIFWGTLFESLTPVIFVFLSFYFLSTLLGVSKDFAIILSSIAATTAPATTVALVEQYKTKGKFTQILLGIVALDDAFGVMLFTVITSIYFQGSFTQGLIFFSKELAISLAVGGFLGMSLSKFAHLSKTDDYLFPLLLGLVLIILGTSSMFHFSPLLGCMMLGFVSNNTFKTDTKVSLLMPIQHIEEFVFITFFTMAGTHFNIGHFTDAFPFIALYIVSRSIGKYLGAFIGISIANGEDKRIPKFMGFALLPQAGIAIGLAFQLLQRPEGENIKFLVINTILGSTLFYEIVGPLCSKFALQKAGEIEI